MVDDDECHDVVGDGVPLTDRGILAIERPRIAAEHFNWLVLSIPLHRSLYLSSAGPTEQEIDELAGEAVRISLAAYGSPVHTRTAANRRPSRT